MSAEEDIQTEVQYDLAIDAMGGDHAPDIVVKGLAITALRHPKARILLIGNKAELLPLLKKYPKASEICRDRKRVV